MEQQKEKFFKIKDNFEKNKKWELKLAESI